ncbi:unnamed protein product [Amoebophrya sp. A25]|nr:unnamed protein product [Amoebophrya sp. A25]|eukprot:GSA25T00015568001.1
MVLGRKRRLATGAVFGAVLAYAQSAPPATATEVRTERLVETINDTAKQTRSMLQSLLLANSQSMFSVSNMQKALAGMRKQLALHDKNLAKCESELSEFKSATKYSQQTWAAQHQINTVDEAALLQTGQSMGEGDMASFVSTMEQSLKKEMASLQRNRVDLVSSWRTVAGSGHNSLIQDWKMKKAASLLQKKAAVVHAGGSNGVPVMTAAERMAEHAAFVNGDDE